jgi:hypothetical protein
MHLNSKDDNSHFDLYNDPLYTIAEYFPWISESIVALYVGIPEEIAEKSTER